MKRPTHTLKAHIADSFGDAAFTVFSAWLQREALATDLTAANRNRCLLAMVDAGETKERVYTAQRGIKKLWKAAHAAGEIDTPAPERMFCDTFDTRPAAPWTADEMARLVEGARTFPFRTPYFDNGLLRTGFWESFVRITQETRLQRPMSQSIRWESIDLEAARLDLTGNQDIGMAFRLSRGTVEALESIRFPKRELVLQFDSYKNVFNTCLFRLLAHAQVNYRPAQMPRGNARKPMRKGMRP